MNLVFSTHAWEDYLHWQETDKRMLKRINTLIRETMRDPFSGIGKPERLRHGLAGYWSRRINDEHRFVYRPSDEALFVLQLRYHY
ncbi:MAG: Txe/YoeB family addiction module toxin [Thermodesulfobacteriota bacterium]